jgi:hypothetical protein
MILLAANNETRPGTPGRVYLALHAAFYAAAL